MFLNTEIIHCGERFKCFSASDAFLRLWAGLSFLVRIVPSRSSGGQDSTQIKHLCELGMCLAGKAHPE